MRGGEGKTCVCRGVCVDTRLICTEGSEPSQPTNRTPAVQTLARVLRFGVMPSPASHVASIFQLVASSYYYSDISGLSTDCVHAQHPLISSSALPLSCSLASAQDAVEQTLQPCAGCLAAWRASGSIRGSSHVQASDILQTSAPGRERGLRLRARYSGGAAPTDLPPAPASHGEHRRRPNVSVGCRLHAGLSLGQGPVYCASVRPGGAVGASAESRRALVGP